jgi:hypothetical protein
MALKLTCLLWLVHTWYIWCSISVVWKSLYFAKLIQFSLFVGTETWVQMCVCDGTQNCWENTSVAVVLSWKWQWLKSKGKMGWGVVFTQSDASSACHVKKHKLELADTSAWCVSCMWLCIQVTYRIKNINCASSFPQKSLKLLVYGCIWVISHIFMQCAVGHWVFVFVNRNSRF